MLKYVPKTASMRRLKIHAAEHSSRYGSLGVDRVGEGSGLPPCELFLILNKLITWWRTCLKTKWLDPRVSAGSEVSGAFEAAVQIRLQKSVR